MRPFSEVARTIDGDGSVQAWPEQQVGHGNRASEEAGAYLDATEELVAEVPPSDSEVQVMQDALAALRRKRGTGNSNFDPSTEEFLCPNGQLDTRMLAVVVRNAEPWYRGVPAEPSAWDSIKR